jgi:N-methylhydantoinase A/oxoprolinase/acetone carboxylase beta subunit
MRYLGQRYEVNFGLPDGRLSAAYLPALSEAFYVAYREQYGREIREVPVEAVTWRVTVAGPRPSAELAFGGNGAATGRPPVKARREVYFASDGYLDSAVYDRRALAPGAHFTGPAVVEDRESTAVIPPASRVSLDAQGTLVIDLDERS